MTLDQLWKFVNQPLVILVVGSGLGWLFLKFFWEPFQIRKANSERSRAIRDEVMFRLYRFATRKDGRQDYEIAGDSDQSRIASCLNPIYRTWTLEGLIYAGWGNKVFTESLPHIEKLADDDHPELHRRALDELGDVLSK